MSDSTRVGVIGTGLMESGIAEVCARAGLDVLVGEIDDAALSAGGRPIEKSLGRGMTAGKLTAADRDAALGRLSYTVSLSDMADRNLVVEEKR